MNTIKEVTVILLKGVSKEAMETALGVCFGLLTCTIATADHLERSHS